MSQCLRDYPETRWTLLPLAMRKCLNVFSTSSTGKILDQSGSSDGRLGRTIGTLTVQSKPDPKEIRTENHIPFFPFPSPHAESPSSHFSQFEIPQDEDHFRIYRSTLHKLLLRG